MIEDLLGLKDLLLATLDAVSRFRVGQLKSWGLKQVTIGAVVGLSQARVSQMLSQGL